MIQILGHKKNIDENENIKGVFTIHGRFDYTQYNLSIMLNPKILHSTTQINADFKLMDSVILNQEKL